MRREQSVFGRESRLLFLIVLGVVACLSSGCSGGTKTNPVSGHVTVNGQPLTSGSVVFHADKSKGNSFGGVCVGEINSQGEYKLQTNGKPGAPPGWYKVTVTSTGPTTPDNTNPSKTSAVNTTYSLPDITPLEVHVVDKASPGAYDLKLGP